MRPVTGCLKGTLPEGKQLGRVSDKETVTGGRLAYQPGDTMRLDPWFTVSFLILVTVGSSSLDEVLKGSVQ